MEPSDRIAIVIIDDNRLVREALTSMLNTQAGLRAVCSNVADAGLLAEAKPHVLLLDVGLRDQDSVRVAARLKQENPGARIIVMDLLPADAEMADYIEAGVSGFVLKDATFEEFVATIRAVAAGKTRLPAPEEESLLARIAKEVRRRAPAEVEEAVRLTPREREVIDLIGEGLSNKEIASRLNVATHTVKSHVRNVMEKLALHTRLQIAAYTHREGSA